MTSRTKQTARLIADSRPDQPRRAPRIVPMDEPPAMRLRGIVAGFAVTAAAGGALWCGRADWILWGAALLFACGSIVSTIRNV